MREAREAKGREGTGREGKREILRLVIEPREEIKEKQHISSGQREKASKKE